MFKYTCFIEHLQTNATGSKQWRLQKLRNIPRGTNPGEYRRKSGLGVALRIVRLSVGCWLWGERCSRHAFLPKTDGSSRGSRPTMLGKTKYSEKFRKTRRKVLMSGCFSKYFPQFLDHEVFKIYLEGCFCFTKKLWKRSFLKSSLSLIQRDQDISSNTQIYSHLHLSR